MERRELLTRIRAGMAAGTLPREDCIVTWFGPGRGRRCAACDERIPSTAVEVECDLPEAGTVYFHSACYELWHAALLAP